MKKILIAVLMTLITITAFAQEQTAADKPEVQAVMKILEGKSWTIIADRANLANSISVDNMLPDRNFFSCTADDINVHIDFTGADARNTGMTAHKARRVAGEIRSTGNTLATLPPMYIATYHIDSQDITVDKKGRHVTAKIKYTVEDANVTNMGSTPTLDIHIDTRDLSCTVSFVGFRSGETYYGKLLEKVKVK